MKLDFSADKLFCFQKTHGKAPYRDRPADSHVYNQVRPHCFVDVLLAAFRNPAVVFRKKKLQPGKLFPDGIIASVFRIAANFVDV